MYFYRAGWYQPDFITKETAEKEVQDTSCRGSGGFPHLQKSPKIGGYRGFIETISAVSLRGVRFPVELVVAGAFTYGTARPLQREIDRHPFLKQPLP